MSMTPLIRLVSQEVFKMNCTRFRKFFMCDRPSWNRFLHLKNSLAFKKNGLNSLSKRDSFRKYSTGKPPAVDAFKGNDRNKEMQENRNEVEIEDDEDEDESENENDYYSDYDVDTDSDDEDDESRNKKTEEIFEEIANGDPDILKDLKILQFEMVLLKEQGNKVPNNPTKSQWKELLATPVPKRKPKLAFMSLNETLSILKTNKKKIKHMKARKRKAEAGFHYYGLSGQSMFLRVYDKSINKLLIFRHLMAKQKILFDCSYQEFMNDKCTKQVAKQIHMCLIEAKMHRYPCQLAFCSLDKNDMLGKVIPKYVPNIFDETFYCDVSAQSALDIYPKERLLYLSPHAPNDLIEFNRDDIYIIGAYVDKGSSVKASLAKAKKDGLRMARLPIDHFICWKQGSKALPLNTVLKIMLDMSFYNDWSIAFKSISSRLKNDAYSKRKFSISNEVEEI